MLPIFIHGRKVAFSTNFTRLSGRILSIQPEDLLTPFGLFIPTDALGLGILEWLRYGKRSNFLSVEELSGIVIDHNGDIHELRLKVVDRVKVMLNQFSMRDGNVRTDLNDDLCIVQITREYIPSASSLRYALSSVGEFEIDAIMALQVEDTIEKSIDLFMKRSMVQTAEYISLDFDNITAVLKERGFTKVIPVKWLSTMTDEEVKEFDEIEKKRGEGEEQGFKIPDKIKKQLDE